MSDVAKKIMKRMSEQKTGWIGTPKDFADIGASGEIDQALRSLVKAGRLRRVDRGLYDVPKVNRSSKEAEPADLYSAVTAVARRKSARVMPDGSVYANMLGLASSPPESIFYDTDGPSRTLTIVGKTVRFRHAPPKVMLWADRPGAPVVQALRWLGSEAGKDPHVVATLKRVLPDHVKSDLLQGIGYLPIWMQPIVRKLTEESGG
ncbi:MAG: DUF6088 family protein [Candidatus Dadabacteria bacterium]|nr:DUF6088 family protein [Candidatus Dadabacteria bacterium]MDE0291579.1 DUF6088 family protein [Candidatus Dadabacteria bacterium]MDE0476557.1 DUF6088 family protein [Candidatus Dadabacteria bacterium]